MALQEEMIQTLKGFSKFASDIKIKNSYYGKIITSPIHKGTFSIKNLPELPHEYHFITAKDIPGKNKLSLYTDHMPFLSEKEIHFQGEPLCLLCGPLEDKLERLAGQIHIEYQEKTPCLSIESATETDILQKEYLHKGNAEQTFLKCAKIIENEYRSDFEEYQFIEPQTAIAYWENKKLTVYCTTKNLFYTRNNIAKFLNISQNQANVIVPDFVQDQGEKQILPTLIASYAALLSYTAKKPVIISYNNTVKRYPSIIRHKTAIDENHLPIGAKIELLMDAGAFNIAYPSIFKRALFSVCGAYELDNVEISASYIRTNKIPFTRFLNTGALEAFFAIELHTSNIARVCELDPYTLKTNLLQRPQAKNTQKEDSSERIKEILDDVIKRSDFLRKHGAYEAFLKRKNKADQLNSPMRGVGLSLCFFGFDFLDEYTKATKYSIKLSLHKNNNLTIYTSAVETDQSLKQLFASIASRLLGITPAKISFVSQNTKDTPDSGPLTETRVITQIGKLLEQGCHSLLTKKKKGKFPITITKTNSISAAQDTKAKLYKSTYCDSLTWCAAVIEIEIQPVTIEVICKNIWLTIEAGTILELDKVRIQVEKEILSGIRSVTFKQAFKDHKYTPKQNLPLISLSFLEKPFKHGPLGAKGIGELPSLCVAPAYVAAVSQAIGINITKFPLTPENIEGYLIKNED
ncbi:MAG: molybdopterin-dependent oxidoreductase [Spirochaetales bacterium]|nr:molybdopterin-dependent oxidoreductase [Spirochaetales bacterium]